MADAVGSIDKEALSILARASYYGIFQALAWKG